MTSVGSGPDFVKKKRNKSLTIPINDDHSAMNTEGNRQSWTSITGKKTNNAFEIFFIPHVATEQEFSSFKLSVKQ